MSTPAHPSAETLADLYEGLLDPHQAEQVVSHVADCPICAPLSAAVQSVSATLAAEALDPWPMPADVAALLDDALRVAQVERAAGVPSLAARRDAHEPAVSTAATQRRAPRRRGRRADLVLRAAATLAVVGLGIGGWQLAAHQDNGSTPNALSATGSPEHSTGSDKFNRGFSQQDSQRAPVLTPANLPQFARSQHGSWGLAGGTMGSTQITPRTTPGPSGGSCMTPAIGRSVRVLWHGRPAMLDLLDATRTAQILDCATATHVLYSTHF